MNTARQIIEAESPLDFVRRKRAQPEVTTTPRAAARGAIARQMYTITFSDGYTVKIEVFFAHLGADVFIVESGFSGLDTMSLESGMQAFAQKFVFDLRGDGAPLVSFEHGDGPAVVRIYGNDGIHRQLARAVNSSAADVGVHVVAIAAT